MTPEPPFSVVCIDNHAFLGFNPDGTLGAARPDEFLSISLTVGKVYEVIAVEWDGSMYRLIDDTADDYLFPIEMFRVIEP